MLPNAYNFIFILNIKSYWITSAVTITYITSCSQQRKDGVFPNI